MFDKMLFPFAGNDFAQSQNRIGAYISFSIWTVSSVFCFYYLLMGAEVSKLIVLGALALVGYLATYLFYKSKNIAAVLVQCLIMYLSLMVVHSLPVIGPYTIMCILIITLTPVILLNKMRSAIVFVNLIITVALLSTYELLLEPPGIILEQILDFFIKLMVIIFVFVQVYTLRLLLERKTP